MTQFPHMPLATDAYLADTTHLTAQEHGVYLLLLITAWRVRGRPCLPDDDKMLARYAKLDPRTWKAMKPTIMAFWQLGEDGYWIQKKQQEMREMASKRVEAARKKAAKRWEAKSLENNDNDDAGALQEGCTDDATKTKPTIVGIEEPKGSLSETAVPDHSKPSKKNTYPEDFEAAWKAYPRTQNMSKAEALPPWRKLSPKDRELVIRSIPNYIAFLKTKPDLEVIHFCRYLSKRRFEGHAGTAQDTMPDWAKRLAYARAHRVWPVAEWGPMPGRQGCTVPSELLAPSDGANWSEHQRVA